MLLLYLYTILHNSVKNFTLMVNCENSAIEISVQEKTLICQKILFNIVQIPMATYSYIRKKNVELKKRCNLS